MLNLQLGWGLSPVLASSVITVLILKYKVLEYYIFLNCLGKNNQIYFVDEEEHCFAKD